MSKKSTELEGSQFVRYFGPVLHALRELGGSGTPREVIEQIARDLSLPDEVQNELMNSGEPRFPNQVAWARFYLTKAGYLDSSRRGIWNLTDQGRSTPLTQENSRALYLELVKQFSEDRKRSKNSPSEQEKQIPAEPESGPIDYRERLLQLLMSLPPGGFERLCQRLLRESGFVQVVVTGRSGDGGIDGYGTLEINPLVSFKVLFQSKRYAGSVSSPQIRDFRGAMQGRADKGIILTTGNFTADARREASRDGVPPIELVDGQKLIDMFVRLELGLKQVTTYEIDSTFFDEFSDTIGAI